MAQDRAVGAKQARNGGAGLVASGSSGETARAWLSAVQPANVEVISQGASAINMTFVVREEDGPDVVRRLHKEFFGTC